MKKVRPLWIFVLLLGAVIFSRITTQAFALGFSQLGWQELQPKGAGSFPWLAPSISNDGKTILAPTANQGFYLSRDAGQSWEENEPNGVFINDGQTPWVASAISGDGQKMIAAADTSRIYISNNNGRSWEETYPAGDTDQPWQSLTMSENGQVILAGTHGGRLYKSVNGGVSWFETRPAGDANGNWLGLSSNYDGQRLIAGIYSGRLYYSQNAGASWSELQPNGDQDTSWLSSAMSDNGQTIVAGSDGYRLFISKDGGTSWNQLQLEGDTDQDWRTVKMSGDGQTILVGQSVGTTANGRLFLSLDGGETWTESQPNGDQDISWDHSAMSHNGYSMVLFGGSRMYLGEFPRPNPPVQASIPGPADCSDRAPAAAPTLFQINSNKNSATLYFSPPSGDVTSYAISYGYAAGDERFGTEFAYGKSTGVVKYTIHDLKPSTKYSFSVRANNGCAAGTTSNWLSAKTSRTLLQKLVSYLHL